MMIPQRLPVSLAGYVLPTCDMQMTFSNLLSWEVEVSNKKSIEPPRKSSLSLPHLNY